MMIQKTSKRRLRAFLLVVVLGFSFFFSCFSINTNAAATSHTSVMTDLRQDPNFDESAYPSVPDANSIKVIQIGEGKDGELFIYTYQPGAATKHYKAKYINMSLQTASDKDLEYKLYSLTWLSGDGVFDKYVVNGFTVSSEAYRNYTIAAIYRIYDDAVDTSSDSEAIDNVQCKSFEVAQTWCVYYYNNKLVYEMEHVNVVEITNHATGSVRYDNGFVLYKGACDSHYVAFSIDNFDVQKIFDADVTYTIYTGSTTVDAATGSTHTTWDGLEVVSRKLTELETGGNSGAGLFGKKYTWNRITTTDRFVKDVLKDTNDTFSEEEMKGLNESQFVFRLVETTYEEKNFYAKYSTVSEIGILRLHFLSEGQVYNLGVVGDLVGTDLDPEVEVDPIEDQEWWQKLMLMLCLILVVVALSLFSGPLLIVLKVVFTGIRALFSILWALLTLPFRLIFGLLFSGRR